MILYYNILTADSIMVWECSLEEDSVSFLKGIETQLFQVVREINFSFPLYYKRVGEAGSHDMTR